MGSLAVPGPGDGQADYIADRKTFLRSPGRAGTVEIRSRGSQRAEATASAMRATCAISATSCTRTMCAPPRIAAVTVAAVPHSRFSTGHGSPCRPREPPPDKHAFSMCPPPADSRAAPTPANARAARNFAHIAFRSRCPDRCRILILAIPRASARADRRAQAARSRLASRSRRNGPLCIVLRRAPHVHQDQRHAPAAHHFGQRRVEAQARSRR